MPRLPNSRRASANVSELTFLCSNNSRPNRTTTPLFSVKPAGLLRYLMMSITSLAGRPALASGDLVSRPFKLVVHFSRGNQNNQFRKGVAKTGAAPQIFVRVSHGFRHLGAVQANSRWPLQSRKGLPLRVPLACHKRIFRSRRDRRGIPAGAGSESPDRRLSEASPQPPSRGSGGLVHSGEIGNRLFLRHR